MSSKKRNADRAEAAGLFAGLDTEALGRILNRAEVARLPAPDPLIDGWLDQRAVTLLVGATGTNKSFTALGWACSVATGHPWLGHNLEAPPGTAIYVVGEGGGGLASRLDAWESESGVAVPPERLVFLLRPESISDAAFWKQLQEVATAADCRLVVLDTFSSLASTADETKDVAPVLRYAADLAAEAHVAVVIVHHTGWSAQNRARGASQFEANADAVIVALKPKADDETAVESYGPVTLWRKKVKDGPAGGRLVVDRVDVDASCVLRVVEASGPGVHLSMREARRRTALIDALSAEPWTLTRTEAVKAVPGDDKPLRRILRELLADGSVTEKTIRRPDGSGREQPAKVLGPADRVSP